MELKIDPRAGFCGGVKRVIKMAEEIIEEKGEVLSLGQIIHNHTESDRLMEKGMKVVDYNIFENPEKYKNRTILIRAHGTPESTMEKAKAKGLSLVDGTCPVVTKSQNLVKEYFEKGFQIVIVGKAHHPEVIGIQGRCDNEAIVVNKVDDLENIDFSKKTFVLTQTTMPLELFENLVARMKEKMDDLAVHNTICRFVLGRDKQLKEFVKTCDVIVMVGGKHSSNTKWLYGVCKEINPRSFWIEEKEEIDFSWFEANDCVGITGSASTPQWLLEDVLSYIEDKLMVEK